MSLASAIDYTLLKPFSEALVFEQLCETAVKHSFAAVCVPPSRVSFCANLLKGSKIGVATVIGFPCGYDLFAGKLKTLESIPYEDLTEVDYVPDFGAILDGEWKKVNHELSQIRIYTAEYGIQIKLITEASQLTDNQLQMICKLAYENQWDCIKTSTGMLGSPEASPELIKRIRTFLDSDLYIKASGGIKTKEQAQLLLDSGAERIGTSSLLI